MANLLVTLMDKMDVPVERLGGSTGSSRSTRLDVDVPSLPRAFRCRSFFARGVPPRRRAARPDRGGEECRSRGVRALIQQKADVNAAEADGTTALHWASYRDDARERRALDSRRRQRQRRQRSRRDPLWNASMNAGAPWSRRCSTRRESQPGAARRRNAADGRVALGQGRLVELLLAKGAKVNAAAARGQTALMWAASQQHPAVVKVLLAHGADRARATDVGAEMMAVPPHGVQQYNKVIPHGGDTALLFAARAGDLESAKLLVAAGANVNDADAWGVSATVMAAHAGFTDLVEFLLERGADPNAAAAGSPHCMRRSCGATRGWSPRSLPAAPIRTRHSDLDADAPIVAATSTLRPSSSAQRLLAGRPVQRARRDAAAAEARRRRESSCITPTITTKNQSSRARRSRTR